MLRTLGILNFGAFLFCFASAPLSAQGNSQNVDLPDRAAILVPGSSVEMREDVGHRAHTNHVILLKGTPQATAPSGMTPAQIYAAYAFTAGGSGTIAIVDAYDYPTAESDLNTFSSQFGLPPCTSANGCFKKVYATAGGKAPRVNCGWAQEAALDIEWAHAMAPHAKIVLVESASSSFADLLTAVDTASGIVTANGGSGQVSMSWGGSEFSSETGYDSHFNKAGVVYFAASGDTGGKTIWPGVSPNAVSAGGTTLKMSGNSVTSETGWSGSGGGPSKYEGRPTYQAGIQTLVGNSRGVPDFSFDADPYTGVSVYDSTSCQGSSGWMVFGGTSVSSPSLAGIVNSAGGNTSTASELSLIYGGLGSNAFRDITSGTAGSYSAQPGWDFVTGVGSNLGLAGK
ncbi:MAG TPA: S53 family peptidase [Bryobacteraceae bacterium]